MGCDIHCYAETRKNGRWTADGAATVTKDEWGMDMESSFNERNYRLFGLLAQVRRECAWSFSQRGLPDDMSEEVRSITKRWDADGHSHSWLSLEDLRSKRMELLLQSASDAAELNEDLGDLLGQLGWPEGAPGDEHRIVFFFDN